jgi:hypothetical protein
MCARQPAGEVRGGVDREQQQLEDVLPPDRPRPNPAARNAAATASNGLRDDGCNGYIPPVQRPV